VRFGAAAFVSVSGGYGGCLALQTLASALVGILEPIEFDPAAAEIGMLWSKAAGD
jgi:hypothetical protein